MKGIHKDLFRESIESMAKIVQQYNKHVEESLINVRMEIGNIAQDHEAIKEIIRTQYSEQYLSATEEGDHEMKETLVELKSKTNDIDATVRSLEKSVAVIENTVKLNFDTVNKTLAEIKSSIDALTAPISSLTVQVTEAKSEIGFIQKRFNDLATNKKWLVTTIIAGLGLAATIVKIIIG